MIDLSEAAQHLLQLAIAFALALPIAWDREHRERSAGLRTFTLVAISTCGFLMAARSALGPSADAQSRVWQGLLTGIGFIGSGAILKTQGAVRGVPRQPQVSGIPRPLEPPLPTAATTSPSH